MHVMIDIETLGTTPGSAILSIGAVAFDPLAGSLGESFCCNIDLSSAVTCGLRIDPETIGWWMDQSEAARRAAFAAQPRLSLFSALENFRAFLRARGPSDGDLRLWGHGATFDPVLLATAYGVCHLPVPWAFREVRDTRTLFDLADIPTLAPYRLPEDEHHNPLSDAKVQARAVIEAYRRLRLPAGETFETIAHWAEGTFGPIALSRAAERASEEMRELESAPEKVEEAAMAAFEIAQDALAGREWGERARA